ncbi:MAG: NAD(P)/FAD-dependent oxidoreductase [Actinobacteria bacterium]|nr:NAD(P)/FAD-dependent oxidoreductase [Actinomycetota bacterium]
MAPVRDVVVVGAGHNALVAACYLARAGLDVEVVERRDVVGGAVSTVERFPGYHMDVGSSAHIMVRHTGIVEELDLAAHGLVYQDLDPWGYAPFDSDAIALHVDLDAACQSIAKVCGDADAYAYHGFASAWSAHNLKVFEAFQHPPTGRHLVRHLAGIGRSSGVPSIELGRQFLLSGDELLDLHFTDERLKTALAWMGAQSGPPTHQPATAELVAWNMVMHRLPPGHPVGGSGMLSVALARRFAAAGGTLRLGDAATHVEVGAAGVHAVQTASGDRIACRAVIAGCHILETVDLLGDGLLGATARTVNVGNGIGMVVRVATDALPQYPSATGPEAWGGMQLLAPSRHALRAAWADYLLGRPPAEPIPLVMTFSAFDDTIAPAGKHNITIWAQWHAYELANGEHWDEIADREGHKLVAAVDRAAPGFADSVEHLHVQTPLELERELGLRRGTEMHLQRNLAQIFAWRPTPQLSGNRTPVTGLYLTGASTHPGGGVFGASGRSAAKVLLADRRPRWWRPWA